MTPIPVMVNGIPGKMAATVAEHVNRDERFRLAPAALTGPEITELSWTVDGTSVQLIRPADRETVLDRLEAGTLCVDYTHPAAVNDNARFYCAHGLPFVMGTTGGDRDDLARTVANSDTAAVIAPNMAKQIVGFGAMMAWAAETFPGLFSGYNLTIRESHQQGKADTSGTAKAMVQSFNGLGIPFSADRIEKVRDPEVQVREFGIPSEHLDGHGWHTYTLVSPDETVRFTFTHNVNGRDIYARGTLDAVAFLANRVREGVRGTVFSMIDVLKGGER